jgi:tetratricopeptide (TPR) repeat protein
VENWRCSAAIGDLRDRVDVAASRHLTHPHDARASMDLATSLLRLARVTEDTAAAIRAEGLLRGLLNSEPDGYLGRRQLAAALLAQHRFGDAIREADRCLATQPGDTAALGIVADAAVELGEYRRAFAAVEAMLATRPDAGAYARASFLKRLLGDVDGAVRLMRMAAAATSPTDADALAWAHVELGQLLLEQNRPREARREIEHGRHLLAGFPEATRNLARALAADGRIGEALVQLQELLGASPSPADHALAADLFARLGRPEMSARHARIAEAAWRSDAADPVSFAHFLIARGRAEEAVMIAGRAASTKSDVFTIDALAWAQFRAGRLEQASEGYARIDRSGLRPPAVKARAQAVAEALARAERSVR